MAEKVNLSVDIVETRRTRSQTLWSHATGHMDQFLTRMFNGNRINPPGDTAGTSRRQAVSQSATQLYKLAIGLYWELRGWWQRDGDE